MDEVVLHPISIGAPNQMKRDAEPAQPICPECDVSFIECTCPKPWSSLETDGYQVVLEENELVAYPSPETYEGLSLWIFRNHNYVICGHCLQWIMLEWECSEDLITQLVESFFELHSACNHID